MGPIRPMGSAGPYSQPLPDPLTRPYHEDPLSGDGGPGQDPFRDGSG